LVLFNIIISYVDERVKMALIKFPNDTKQWEFWVPTGDKMRIEKDKESSLIVWP